MILESAIVRITRNLDIIRQRKDESVSSKDNVKKDALLCLAGLVEKAPDVEYHKFSETDNFDVLIGYLLNVLCYYAKDDKSKDIRLHSLNCILILIKRLQSLHVISKFKGRCFIRPLAMALPGVSSALFRIIMSDTKLRKNLLILAVKTLTCFIQTVFLECKHKLSDEEESSLSSGNFIETCDNLATRFGILVEYITSHSSELSKEVIYEILELLVAIIDHTNPELLSRSVISIVKYITFTSSYYREVNPEVELKIIIIVDSLRENIQKCNSDCDNNLDKTVISCLTNLLENLANSMDSKLVDERESELCMLCGLLKLLPRESLTTFLEHEEKKSQLLGTLFNLSEFSTQQPLLLLTETSISDDAIEVCTDRIYTVEKRFKHLSEQEVYLVGKCCGILGENLDLQFLNDHLLDIFGHSSGPNKLFITNLILKGCLRRSDVNSTFTVHLLYLLLDRTQEDQCFLNEEEQEVSSRDILNIVIAIETLITLTDLHLHSLKTSNSQKVIILKQLLCPLLKWASSRSRAISEASLSALTQLSHLYEKDSIKSLIESNIDYIVDGVVSMLDNFATNPEVAEVLAITFKLSSIESFYYFKDVYERIFRILGLYHLTAKSKHLALLLYRTLSILNDWKEAREGKFQSDSNPLEDKACVRTIMKDLDIDSRIKKLQDDMIETERIKGEIEELEREGADEEQILNDIRSGKGFHEAKQVNDEPMEDEVKKVKTTDIQLTEKIIKHSLNLISSNHNETKIIALKTIACGFRILRDNEDTLLPLAHQVWPPLVKRLTQGDYNGDLEVNLCAFECLVSMAVCAKDFIKRRTLDLIIPRLCLFLDSQAMHSKGKREYGPYCMTTAYKCQMRILTHLGALAYHIQLAYSSLWRVIRTTLAYLNQEQIPPLREAARVSLQYLIALDGDCVWYFTLKDGKLQDLPFELIYENVEGSMFYKQK